MPIDKTLPPNQFNTMIRMVLSVDINKVRSIREMTFHALKRLGAKRNLEKAHTKIPKGSDQVDIGSFLTWMNRVKLGEKKPTRQIVAIDATAVKRIKG